MKMIARLLGNVRMTTTILVLVMLSIIGSIAAVSGVIYMNLYSQAMADGEEQQQTNLGVAATILERRISGSVLTWTEEGEIATFQSWAIPPFYDTEVIDSVTRVTRQDAAIYVIDTATGDLGGPAYRKYDLEAWMPGRGDGGAWGEVTSTSNCTDYQARRLGIRFKRKGEKGTHFVHTLNGTAIAMSRALIAVIENYQQADGSVVVPEVLRPWVGKDVIGPR